MLWPYALEAFAEQLNELKVENYGITNMEEFEGITKDIILKNHHTWVYPIIFLDAILQGKIYGLTKWGLR